MNSPLDLDQRQAKAADNSAEARNRREQRAADVQWLMGYPQGRRFVHRLLDAAGIYRSSMTEGLEMVAFNEGRRDAGLRVLAEVSAASPDGYLTMLKENSRADA